MNSKINQIREYERPFQRKVSERLKYKFYPFLLFNLPIKDSLTGIRKDSYEVLRLYRDYQTIMMKIEDKFLKIPRWTGRA